MHQFMCRRPIQPAGWPADVRPHGHFVSFKGSAELKAILMGNRDAFAECLAEKVMIYALGRGLEGYDRRTLKQITSNLAASDYRFSALVSGIVNSVPFQMGRGDAAASHVTKAQPIPSMKGGTN